MDGAVALPRSVARGDPGGHGGHRASAPDLPGAAVQIFEGASLLAAVVAGATVDGATSAPTAVGGQTAILGAKLVVAIPGPPALSVSPSVSSVVYPAALTFTVRGTRAIGFGQLRLLEGGTTIAENVATNSSAPVSLPDGGKGDLDTLRVLFRDLDTSTLGSPHGDVRVDDD
jgi:hypothetical protein